MDWKRDKDYDGIRYVSNKKFTVKRVANRFRLNYGLERIQMFYRLKDAKRAAEDIQLVIDAATEAYYNKRQENYERAIKFSPGGRR